MATYHEAPELKPLDGGRERNISAVAVIRE
jgi:hypothetical protein